MSVFGLVPNQTLAIVYVDSLQIVPSMANFIVMQCKCKRLLNLNNYVVEILDSTSVLARLGSRTIFLLLNDLSHDTHFLACQNMETL